MHLFKMQTLKQSARLVLVSLCFNSFVLRAEDYTQKIYEYLVESGEFLQDYSSIYDFFNRWYINATYENSFQIFNSPTALYDIYNPEGMQEETKMLTYQQYLDFIATSAHEGWRIEPSMWAIHQHLYASNMYTAAENLAKGSLGGGSVTVTNNLTFTLDDFFGVVPVAGDYSYLWSEWLWSLVYGEEEVDDETRWKAYRQLKASRELQQNLNMLTGDGVIGGWNGYGVENWTEQPGSIGYDVQGLLKDVSSGNGANLIDRIINDWGLSPHDKANLIKHVVQGGQRNLINDLNNKLEKIIDDGIKVANTNEFPSGEGGGGGIALPSDFFNTFTNLLEQVGEINTNQNERTDLYSTKWRGNLNALNALMETTTAGIDSEFAHYINNISNSFVTSKNLLTSIWLNPSFTSLESQVNRMLKVLAVYEVPERIIVYKLDGIAQWLYNHGLFAVSNMIAGKDISFSLNHEFSIGEFTLDWAFVAYMMRVLFILFYFFSGAYVLLRLAIIITNFIYKLVIFVYKSFSSIVKIFK